MNTIKRTLAKTLTYASSESLQWLANSRNSLLTIALLSLGVLNSLAQSGPPPLTPYVTHRGLCPGKLADLYLMNVPTTCPSTSTTYAWTISSGGVANGSSSETSFSIRVNSGATRVQGKLTLLGSCSLTSTFDFIVSTPPTLTATLELDKSTVCKGTAITVTPTVNNGGSGPSYSSYVDDVPFNLTTTAGSSNLTLQTSTLSDGPHTLYSFVSSNLGCVSPLEVKTNVVAFTVNAPATPIPTPASIAIPYNTSTTLYASGAASGEVYRWYKSSPGSSLQYQGLSFPTSALTGATFITYYVSKYNPSTRCETPTEAMASQTVTLTVPNPTQPTIIASSCTSKTLRFAPPPGIT